MDFSSYWKEFSIFLVAIFAIASVVWEVKDKRTKKFTNWGRIFLALTVFSALGGFYAQWRDNAAEDKRNVEAQSNMLRLLERTESSVRDLSRLLQPIERPNISLFLKPDCGSAKLKAFCDSVRSQAKREAAAFKGIPGGSFSVKSVDWSAWPAGFLLGHPTIYFFKDAKAADKFLSERCLICDSGGDMHLGFFVTSKNVSVVYDENTEEIEFLAKEDSVLPAIHNDNILSVVDIPGSTMIVSEGGQLLNDLAATTIFIETSRGKTIEATGLQPLNVHPLNLRFANGEPLNVGGNRVFIYHFKSKP
jgi:hypothetical protein